jgi:hypothetical protein
MATYMIYYECNQQVCVKFNSFCHRILSQATITFLRGLECLRHSLPRLEITRSLNIKNF